MFIIFENVVMLIASANADGGNFRARAIISNLMDDAIMRITEGQVFFCFHIIIN